MRRVEAPERSLILRDEGGVDGRETIRFTPSNRGEPYRRTLKMSFERNAYGTWEGYEHIASIELEPDEEAELRAMLNARAADPRR